VTIPQTSASPHRQQRFIELKNVGSATIPPFGVCEVAGSYRPEQTSQYTPNDGRTVMQVRLATKDNPCATIVNFACEIPPGEERRVGTMDDPLLALVAAVYDPGTPVGVKAGSFRLERGYCGYIILGDYDLGTGGTMRVARRDDCPSEMWVQAYECITPGMSAGLADPLKWDTYRKCYVKDTSAPRVSICDPMRWLLALPGDCFKVERLSTCDQVTTGDLCYRPSQPYGLRRLVKVKDEIECHKCGTVTLLKRTNSGSGSDCRTYWAETDCRLNACNMSDRRISCDMEEYAWLDITPGECCPDPNDTDCIGVLTPFTRPMLLLGKIKEDSCEEGMAFSESSYMDACVEGAPLMAGNKLQLHACRNGYAIAVWDEPTCGWETVGISDVELPDWMVDVACKEGSCTLQKTIKTHKYYGHFCHCDDQSEHDVDTKVTGQRITLVSGIEEGTGGDGYSVMTDAECSSCGFSFDTVDVTNTRLKIKQKSYCMFCPQEETEDDGYGPEVASISGAGSPVTLTGSTIDVVTGLEMKSEVVEGEGGESVDCDTGAGLNLLITGTTKRVCAFCSTGDGGTFTSGNDVQLTGFKLSQVSAVTDVDFACDPCLAFDYGKTSFYAMCVGDEVAGSSVECSCEECPDASASATPTPSGTGA
jgi:hypothetical protein